MRTISKAATMGYAGLEKATTFRSDWPSLVTTAAAKILRLFFADKRGFRDDGQKHASLPHRHRPRMTRKHTAAVSRR